MMYHIGIRNSCCGCRSSSSNFRKLVGRYYSVSSHHHHQHQQQQDSTIRIQQQQQQQQQLLRTTLRSVLPVSTTTIHALSSTTTIVTPIMNTRSFIKTTTTTTTTTIQDYNRQRQLLLLQRYFSSSTNNNTTEETKSETYNEKVKKMYKKDQKVIKKKKKKSEKQEIADAYEEALKEEYNRNKTIYIKLCYTDHDLEEGDIVKAKFHWDSIVNVTSEEFGLDENESSAGKLEYHVNDDWIKLVPYRLYEVLQYYPCTRKHPLPLRVPKLYDEEYGTRNDIMKLKKVTPEMRQKQKKIVQMGPSAQQWLMKDMIECIIKKCKHDGYSPSSNTTLQNPIMSFQYHDTDGSLQKIEMSTYEFVLDIARNAPWKLPSFEEEREMEDAKLRAEGKAAPGTKENPFNMNSPKDPHSDPDVVMKKMKHVLLSQPGALRHIVECVHYDYHWSP